MVHAAANRTQEGKKREALHTGDKAMRRFIGTMNGLWLTYARRFPGVTVATKPSKKRAALGAKAKPPRGSYVAFVDNVLLAYAREIPDELHAQLPELRNNLRRGPHAIHSYFRHTKISKLRHF